MPVDLQSFHQQHPPSKYREEMNPSAIASLKNLPRENPMGKPLVKEKREQLSLGTLYTDTKTYIMEVSEKQYLEQLTEQHPYPQDDGRDSKPARKKNTQRKDGRENPDVNYTTGSEVY
ncbi:hypothetical protein Tco_0242285 [Tanacetum coccineum]